APAPGSWLSRLVNDALVDQSTRLYRVVNAVLTGAILASVLLVIIESVESIFLQNELLFHSLESIILAIFTVEYVANLYLATHKRRYIFSFWGVVDLLAILPTYLALM